MQARRCNQVTDTTAGWDVKSCQKITPYRLATFTSGTDTLAGSAYSGTSDPILDEKVAPTAGESNQQAVLKPLIRCGRSTTCGLKVRHVTFCIAPDCIYCAYENKSGDHQNG